MADLTLEEVKASMAASGLDGGEMRRYQQCRTCKQFVVREFIPYGLGRGRTFNPCMCYCTGNDRRGYDDLEDVMGPLPWPGQTVIPGEFVLGEPFVLRGVPKTHEEY